MNKRVSELSLLQPADLASNDLFLVSDISAIESKRITVGNLSTYFQSTITSSLTSSNAINADTASYLLYQGFPNGTASYALVSGNNISSSHALWANTASHALYSISASYALTSSHALTASYALTSSVQLIYSSAFADYAKSASYLIYTEGVSNGTASYALSSSLSRLSQTASYLLYNGAMNGTASYALSASAASRSIQSSTASYLLYSGINNGTASHALTASRALRADKAVTVQKPMLYGIYDGEHRSISGSSLGIGVVDTLLGPTHTIITAYGTVYLTYTSSASETVSLYINDTAIETLLDSSSFSISNGSSNDISGSIRVPFTLVGEDYLLGNYNVYVSASSGIYIDTNRAVKFRIETQSDNFYII